LHVSKQLLPHSVENIAEFWVGGQGGKMLSDNKWTRPTTTAAATLKRDERVKVHLQTFKKSYTKFGFRGKNYTKKQHNKKLSIFVFPTAETILYIDFPAPPLCVVPGRMQKKVKINSVSINYEKRTFDH
jgi:hypothetical protein